MPACEPGIGKVILSPTIAGPDRRRSSQPLRALARRSRLLPRSARIGQAWWPDFPAADHPGLGRAELSRHHQGVSLSSHQTDCWMPAAGMLQVALVDLRRHRATFGAPTRCTSAHLRPWQILIPPGVAHGYKVIGEQPSMLDLRHRPHLQSKGRGPHRLQRSSIAYDWELTAQMKILVTGGAGFIGSCFVRIAIAERLGRTSRQSRQADLRGQPGKSCTCRRPSAVTVSSTAISATRSGGGNLLPTKRPMRSSTSPPSRTWTAAFSRPRRSFRPIFNGTFTLLEAARRNKVARFVHVSTDEVYGSLEAAARSRRELSAARQQPVFGVEGRLGPAGAFLLHHLQAAGLGNSRIEQLRSVPVSRKADSADDLERAGRQATAGLWRWPTGARLALCGRSLPRHPRGAGKGRDGEIYNIGGNCSLPNLEVVQRILKATGKPESLITHVTDRPGHDRRYALSNAKIDARNRLGAGNGFRARPARTVDWYRRNPDWVRA